MTATKTRVKPLPEDQVRLTPTMRAVNELLRERTGMNLGQFIVHIRDGESPARAGEDTWDDVAYWIRFNTSIRCVRETVKNWAAKFGLPLVRPGETVDAPAD